MGDFTEQKRSRNGYGKANFFKVFLRGGIRNQKLEKLRIFIYRLPLDFLSKEQKTKQGVDLQCSSSPPPACKG